MASVPQSREGVTEHVRRSLGYPTLCVELEAENFDDIVDEAEIWLLAHLGQIKRANFSLTEGTSEYAVAADCETVVDVALPTYDRNLDLLINPSAFAETNELPYTYYANTMGGGLASGLTQFMQYTEMTRRALSADTDWYWDQANRMLVIRPHRNSGTSFYWYLSKELDYTMLSLQQIHLLRRYAVAYGKMVLGQIRSKFSEVPTAGGRVTLNGDALISQAQIEMEDIKEALNGLAPPIPFLTG